MLFEKYAAEKDYYLYQKKDFSFDREQRVQGKLKREEKVKNRFSINDSGILLTYI
jgi:hypothetical protein